MHEDVHVAGTILWSASGLSCKLYFRWTPHPVIVTSTDNKDYIRVLLYSDYTTITGWGVPPKLYSKLLVSRLVTLSIGFLGLRV